MKQRKHWKIFFFDLLNRDDVNITFNNIPVFFTKSINSRNCKIILCSSESPYKNTKASALIGDGIYKEFVKDGILTINRLEVKNFEVLKNIKASGVDETIVLIYDNCDEALKDMILAEIIDRSGLEFTVESNKDPFDILMSISENIESYGLYVKMEETTYENDIQTIWYETFTKVFISVSSVFALFALISVSELWIMNRRKELVVRKAFGYTTLQLSVFLLKEYFKLACYALPISVVMQFCYSGILNLNFTATDDFMMLTAIMFTAILLIGVITVISSIIVMQRFAVAEEIKGD